MAVQYKDYYKVLGVEKTASQDDIRKAFRKLAREYHPDVAKDKKSAEAKFKEINEANEVLGDPEKRKRYDELGSDWERGGYQQRAGGGFGGGAGVGGNGFSDFFEAFFGGGGMQGGFGQPGGMRGGRNPFESARPEPRDLETEVTVTVEEALEGTKKRVNFKKSAQGGAETLEVKIPKGVREGQKIRLAGKGTNGGDLYLKVAFASHPHYRLEGDDLVRDVVVPAWRAVLGGEVEVETPDGSVRLKIPAGTQAGRRFRLRGRGLINKAKERGDFYVEVKVSLPETLTEKQRAHWEALSELGG